MRSSSNSPFSPALIIAPCDPAQALLTQPALGLWRLKNKSRPVVVVAKKQVAAIYRSMREVNEVLITPESLLGTHGLLAWHGQLKKHRFQDSYVLCDKFSAKALTSTLNIANRHPYKKISANIHLLGHRSEDYAALLMNLNSAAEVPIHLPVPALRADGNWQRKFLHECGISSEVFGNGGELSKFRTSTPIFMVQLSADLDSAKARKKAVELCLKRWPAAQIGVVQANTLELYANGQAANKPKQTIEISMANRLALISLATAVITDDRLLLQICDAFRTPVVSLKPEPTQDLVPRWPSNQGRFAQSSSASDEILQSLEKVLRFDRQHRTV
jgi:hypothetical protein